MYATESAIVLFFIYLDEFGVCAKSANKQTNNNSGTIEVFVTESDVFQCLCVWHCVNTDRMHLCM